MTTVSWRLDRPNDDSDELPACSSCRKRKLRCSREHPSCFHCLRLNTQCLYDSKQKPGLKAGAVEALNRRVALLEQILLDQDGLPLVRFTPEGTVLPKERSLPIGEHEPPGESLDVVAENGSLAQEEASSTAESQSSSADSAYNEVGPVGNAVHASRQRAGQTLLSSALFPREDGQLVEYLPARDILIELVDKFCVSFHHWIPYLHKARSQAEVRRKEMSPKFVVVLHAIVATGLRRLDTKKYHLNDEEVKRQIQTSRMLVHRQALANVSLESLQALIFLVFDDLNSGKSLQAFSSIALLTRAVDFLRLTVEPVTPSSRVLMKPISLLNSAGDWTELESRRRLFWCIFLLDRYNSAHTGWNTSLTSEDVHRRLPADGAYFTREVPVLCPFFGLWNRSFAKLGLSLAAHVPAQYNNEEETTSEVAIDSSSPVTASSAPVDASKLGAFAYCIEATESMSQVVTFFLQQRIDWQNRQDVVDWLTRFKELDLRLVHWKMFLPTRWKDSNISQDKSLIDMDPNLTLAHITHNTSMILLHYSVAFPPLEWSNLIQLPSACSAETCQLAAVETSHITGKFLRHTPIPFVNPQFSFCVFVAAKALLVIAQASALPLVTEFRYLVANLWTMSARWTGQPETDEYRKSSRLAGELDVAGRYAHYLELLQDRCRENPDFQFDFLDHSCKNLGHSPRTPVDVSTATITKQASAPSADRNSQLPPGAHVSLRKQSISRPAKRPRQEYEVASTNRILTSQPQLESSELTQFNTPSSAQSSLPNTGEAMRREQGPTMQSQQAPGLENDYPPGYFSPSGALLVNNDGMNAYQRNIYDQDALFRLSDTLMNEQFMQMDRVITFEGANFYAPDVGLGW